MSFEWADYLKLAAALAEEPDSLGPEEAALRSAASRAYYAAFCASRNFARDRKELAPTGRSSDHALVRAHFQNSSNRGRQQIGAWLDRLRDNRNAADYDDRLSNPAALARSSVALSNNVFGSLKRL